MNKKYKINFYPPSQEGMEICTLYIKPENGQLKYLCCDSQNQLHSGILKQSLLNFEISKDKDLHYYRHFQKAILRGILKKNKKFLDAPVKFFIYPFAVSGDRVAVPDSPPIDNSMSYQDGFTPPYQGDWPDDPSAIPVPRTQTNQCLYDITNAIQQYQTHGAPDFITSADNGGSPFPYDIYSIVRYDPGSGTQLYISAIDGNTDTPPSANWNQLTGASQVAQVGLTATQSFTAGTPHLVHWDTVEFDDFSIFTGSPNYGFLLQRAGKYRIGAATLSNPMGIGQDCTMFVYKNGSAYKQLAFVAPLADYLSSLVGSTLVEGAIGDLFQIFVNFTGNPQTLTGGVSVNYVNINFVGD